MINFLPQAPSSAPMPLQDHGGMASPYAGFYSRPTARASGGSEVILAWIFGALGIVCCQLFSVAGIILAVMGLNKRLPGALPALIFCIITAVLGFVIGAIFSLGNFSIGP
jgi:hypothetical protein